MPEAQCAGRFEGQGRALQHFRPNADTAGRIGFGLEVANARSVATIGVSVLRLEVASDFELFHPMLDLLHAEAIGIGVALCRLEVERFDEMTIDQRMLSGDLRR